MKEDNNQLAVGFDRTAAAKLANGTSVTGGILFAGVNGNQRDIGDLSRAKFAPRLGAAWQLNDKTVIRGGYGILYAPARYDPISALAPGYTQANNYVASTNNNQTAANSLSNPFPSGLQNPAGNTAGLLTGIGNSVSSYDQRYKAPLVQQFSVERDLPYHVALDVAYIGSRSSNLSPSPAGVLVADMLEGMRFMVGPCTAVRRQALRAIGGFEKLSSYYAPRFYAGQPFSEPLPGNTLRSRH